MLSSFTVENFKSFREAATLEFAPLTVLIGANASGKSNALEALRLLSWVAQGRQLNLMHYALHEDQRATRDAIRGTMTELGHRGARAFSLSCRTTHPDWDRYSVELAVEGEDELLIAGERLAGTAQRAPLFETLGRERQTGELLVAYNDFSRGGKKPQTQFDDRYPVLIQIQSPARFDRGYKKTRKVVPEVARQYHTWLSNIFFLDPHPAEMRMRYDLKTDRTLTESGDNLSGVLCRLCQAPGIKDKILKFMKALPEQDIRDIQFAGTPRGKANFMLVESFGSNGEYHDAALLSDGTLRVLALAAGALSVPEESTLVIEEIDNGVHPSRAKYLLNRLTAVAKERGIRIVVTSHNPALLDALPDEAMADVVFCYRDPQTGASQLTRLGDIADYPALIMQGTVGQLLTRGVIDRFAKDRTPPEERRRRALQSLDELERQVG